MAAAGLGSEITASTGFVGIDAGSEEVAVALSHMSISSYSKQQTYKTNGIHAKLNHPDLVAKAGELPNFSSDQ